jgi:hypothetical protein
MRLRSGSLCSSDLVLRFLGLECGVFTRTFARFILHHRGPRFRQRVRVEETTRCPLASHACARLVHAPVRCWQCHCELAEMKAGNVLSLMHGFVIGLRSCVQLSKQRLDVAVLHLAVHMRGCAALCHSDLDHSYAPSTEARSS